MAILFSAMFLFPFFWTVSTSLKEPIELIAYPPTILPETPRWATTPRSGLWAWASAWPLFSQQCHCDGVCLGGTVDYSLSRRVWLCALSFPGRNVIFAICLSTMILPPCDDYPSLCAFPGITLDRYFLPLIVPSFLGGGAFTIF
ncbi:MAG: hypothetical protein R2867_09875 [Caldilineaceae bacterium]